MPHMDAGRQNQFSCKTATLFQFTRELSIPVIVNNNYAPEQKTLLVFSCIYILQCIVQIQVLSQKEKALCATYNHLLQTAHIFSNSFYSGPFLLCFLTLQTFSQYNTYSSRLMSWNCLLKSDFSFSLQPATLSYRSTTSPQSAN